jgi:REP element-mobilizing transposase RayT
MMIAVETKEKENMSVKKQITEQEGVYFITFTCYQWLSLFELTLVYDLEYKWFDYLKTKGHRIIGYVILPNHVHALIAFRKSSTSINVQVGNGKRFMAYEIVKRLQSAGAHVLLNKLKESVDPHDQKRNKQHKVFEPSFDWKQCRSQEFMAQKLDYMHMNPCKGVWDLARNPIDYLHSSAKFYATGEHGIYTVIHGGFLEDIDLTVNLNE